MGAAGVFRFFLKKSRSSTDVYKKQMGGADHFPEKKHLLSIFQKRGKSVLCLSEKQMFLSGIKPAIDWLQVCYQLN